MDIPDSKLTDSKLDWNPFIELRALLDWTNGHYGIDNDKWSGPNKNAISYYPAVLAYSKDDLNEIYEINIRDTLYGIHDRYGNGAFANCEINFSLRTFLTNFYHSSL